MQRLRIRVRHLPRQAGQEAVLLLFAEGARWVAEAPELVGVAEVQ